MISCFNFSPDGSPPGFLKKLGLGKWLFLYLMVYFILYLYIFSLNFNIVFPLKHFKWSNFWEEIILIDAFWFGLYFEYWIFFCLQKEWQLVLLGHLLEHLQNWHLLEWHQMEGAVFISCFITGCICLFMNK